jgi:DNA-binding Lrp family transcriptional regulator
MDRIDFDILVQLQNNARISNKELAREVGLAPSSCLERVRRLQKDGILRGYHADVDPGALGVGLEALITLRLGRHSRRSIESFLEHARGIPELIALYHLAGANDFLLHVGVRDAHHLRDLAIDAFAQWREVAHIETSLIFSSERKRLQAVGPARPPGPGARTDGDQGRLGSSSKRRTEKRPVGDA